MKIAFIGDVHGYVLHALGALLALQNQRGIRLDAAIQVGDFSAYPSLERMDRPSQRFAAGNPAQKDFLRLLDPSPDLASVVRQAFDHLPELLFVSGNHEDFEWLAELHQTHAADVVPVDPLGGFRHVECGRQVDVVGQNVAFLGRIESPGYLDLDDDAYARLLAAEPGSVDILVTHDGPYGLCQNWHGHTDGSPKLSRLIEHLQPRLHVSGHYHHENGPRRYGRTVSYALSVLVTPKTNKRGLEHANATQRVSPGSIGLFDTETGSFEYLHDDWLADVSGDHLDLARFLPSS